LCISCGGFPKRNLIAFFTFSVIFTLVWQGLSIPTLIRCLEVSDGGADADEEVRARLLIATKAALEDLDALAGEKWTRDETIEDDEYEDRTLTYQQMVSPNTAFTAAPFDVRLRVAF